MGEQKSLETFDEEIDVRKEADELLDILDEITELKTRRPEPTFEIGRAARRARAKRDRKLMKKNPHPKKDGYNG